MHLWRWMRSWRKRRTLEHVEVILYTRQGCHLCEDAHGQLESARLRWKFRLTIHDIDTDPRLIGQYGECVPVVAVNGRVRFRGRINEVLLTRLLRGLSAS